jgi:hypothetical protein
MLSNHFIPDMDAGTQDRDTAVSRTRIVPVFCVPPTMAEMVLSTAFGDGKRQHGIGSDTTLGERKTRFFS